MATDARISVLAELAAFTALAALAARELLGVEFGVDLVLVAVSFPLIDDVVSVELAAV